MFENNQTTVAAAPALSLQRYTLLYYAATKVGIYQTASGSFHGF